MIGMFVNSIDNSGELKFYLKSQIIMEEGLPLDDQSQNLAPISDQLLNEIQQISCKAKKTPRNMFLYKLQKTYEATIEDLK